MRRKAQTRNLEIPGSMREPVIGPRIARTRWHRPGMTSPCNGNTWLIHETPFRIDRNLSVTRSRYRARIVQAMGFLNDRYRARRDPSVVSHIRFWFGHSLQPRRSRAVSRPCPARGRSQQHVDGIRPGRRESDQEKPAQWGRTPRAGGNLESEREKARHTERRGPTMQTQPYTHLTPQPGALRFR